MVPLNFRFYFLLFLVSRTVSQPSEIHTPIDITTKTGQQFCPETTTLSDAKESTTKIFKDQITSSEKENPLTTLQDDSLSDNGDKNVDSDNSKTTETAPHTIPQLNHATLLAVVFGTIGFFFAVCCFHTCRSRRRLKQRVVPVNSISERFCSMEFYTIRTNPPENTSNTEETVTRL